MCRCLEHNVSLDFLQGMIRRLSNLSSSRTCSPRSLQCLGDNTFNGRICWNSHRITLQEMGTVCPMYQSSLVAVSFVKDALVDSSNGSYAYLPSLLRFLLVYTPQVLPQVEWLA